ncbi:hypothetical protein L1887_28042 [Cichorium endivia]|nr:hypothetical protein L1887_28042 [Cichorium endivia]
MNMKLHGYRQHVLVNNFIGGVVRMDAMVDLSGGVLGKEDKGTREKTGQWPSGKVTTEAERETSVVVVVSQERKKDVVVKEFSCGGRYTGKT